MILLRHNVLTLEHYKMKGIIIVLILIFTLATSLASCYNPISQAYTTDNNTKVIVLHKATYQQVINFLGTDNTDKYTYSLKDFDCTDFAIKLRADAQGDDIDCGIAILSLETPDGELARYDHAINVFNTSDKGLVYAEPQVNGTFDIVPTIGLSMTEFYKHLHTHYNVDPASLDYGAQLIYRIRYIW